MYSAIYITIEKVHKLIFLVSVYITFQCIAYSIALCLYGGCVYNNNLHAFKNLKFGCKAMIISIKICDSLPRALWMCQLSSQGFWSHSHTTRVTFCSFLPYLTFSCILFNQVYMTWYVQKHSFPKSIESYLVWGRVAAHAPLTIINLYFQALVTLYMHFCWSHAIASGSNLTLIFCLPLKPFEKVSAFISKNTGT